MTIFVTNPLNDLNLPERLYRESIYSKNFPKYTPLNCLSGINEVKTIQDLKNYVGRYDLSVLLQLTASKISSFSPINFDDFMQYIDESYTLLACLWADTAETVNNSPTKDSKFDLSTEVLSLLFDFFKSFRDAIRNAGEFLLVNLIKKFFVDVLDLVDCNRINKCVIQCNPEANVYKNLHVKLGIKAGKETLLFLENKIKKNKLKDINKDKLLEFFGKTISKIQPEEFNCLLNGFLSTNLAQAIKELFDSIFEGNDYTFDVRDLIEDIESIVEIAPGSPVSSVPSDPCGSVTVETLARIRLRSQGKTDDEINQIIEHVILEGREKLERISQLIKNNPFSINLDLNKNSEITNVIVRKSIDNIFDSFQQIQKSSRTILNNILLRTTGDLNIAFYYLNNLNIEQIDEYMESQITPISISSFINFNENFYEKYNLPVETSKHFSINYFNDIIKISNNGIDIFEIQKNKLIELENFLELDLNNQDISEYITTKSRDDISELFLNQNDPELFPNFSLNLEEIAQEVYDSTIKFMNNQMSELFYFQEFYEESRIAFNKRDFISIDYLNLENSKSIVKGKLNV